MIGNAASGHMGQALQFVARGAEDDGHGVFRDVEMIEEAMSGIGTKDERLSKSTYTAYTPYVNYLPDSLPYYPCALELSKI